MHCDGIVRYVRYPFIVGKKRYQEEGKRPSMTMFSPKQQQEVGVFDITTITGLSEQEAAERLAKEGYNELPSTQQRTRFTIMLDIVREPMFVLLIAGGIIYFLLGDVREALILLGSILVIISITFYQEQKTERALEALRDLSSPRALVIRGGEHKRIAGRDVVRGDTLMLAEGDRVPADGVLLWSNNLSVDESLLTGESVPVRKVAWGSRPGTMALDRPGGDNLPSVFSGTPDAALWWVSGGAAVFLGLVLYVPFLRDLFGFSTLHLIDPVICLVAGGVSVLWFEVFKLVSGRRKQTPAVRL